MPDDNTLVELKRQKRAFAEFQHVRRFTRSGLEGGLKFGSMQDANNKGARAITTMPHHVDFLVDSLQEFSEEFDA